MADITRACNYREGDEAEPAHIVEPFTSSPDDLSEAEGIVSGSEGVRFLGSDVDEGCHLGFVTVGSDDEGALVELLGELSQLGFCVGIG